MIKDLDAILIEFFQSEVCVCYDEIVREDLPITERFNELAYKWYVKFAKINEVLEKEAIPKSLNCADQIGGKLYFTNAGALLFRTNDEDVRRRQN